MIQNIFMYVDSVIMNIFLMMFWSSNPEESATSIDWGESLASLWRPVVISLIINNSIGGIVTSMFLKHLNSIAKVFANSFEMAFTAVLSWIFFDIPINAPTFLAIVIVSVAMYIYTANPVVNLPKFSTVDKNEEQKKSNNI